ncbi:uncharacterized protein LOC100570537 isoform X2 [Acyrthosiphon pisum]|nr:uncharacterized protein LOC100570537 isoform X2 [Acyrthosiphon pisum]
MKQIKVELNMLDTCQLKIDQEMKENDTEYINTEILTILSNRINDMYNSMFLLFPVEKTSLSEYIEFCSNNTLFITKCSNMLDTLMSRYHSDPEVHITAATYEFDDRNDVESARKFFAEGLKYHKNCSSLILEKINAILAQHKENDEGMRTVKFNFRKNLKNINIKIAKANSKTTKEKLIEEKQKILNNYKTCEKSIQRGLSDLYEQLDNI